MNNDKNNNKNTSPVEQENIDDVKVSRKDFLKLPLLAGAAAVASGGLNPAEAASYRSKKNESFTPFRKEHDSIDDIYEISPDYDRIHQRNMMNSRGSWDSTIRPLLMSFLATTKGLAPSPQSSRPGFTDLDFALNTAAFAGETVGTGLSGAGAPGQGVYNDWKRHSNPKHERYEFENKKEAAKIVKRASRFLGADLVGIAPYDDRWTYKTFTDFTKYSILNNKPPVHSEGKFPFEVKSVIAIAFEMDYDTIMCPGAMGEASAALGYSQMAEVGHMIAEFLNSLGYKAIPAGNDTGLSVPIAAQAGLGELSRMGNLITEKYGPRVRLAKVYTDLEMEYDKPITFGVWEFCIKCKKCADVCPTNAISVEDKPTKSSPTGSISSNPGVTKWYQDNKKCFSWWAQQSVSCGLCLAACPYNKLDTWVHDLAKILVGIPVGRDIARQLDDAFGYGKITEENVRRFWDKEVT